MSLSDTIFILIGALVLFGPKKLPELARQVGKIMGELRRASNEFKFQMEEELRMSEDAERRSSAPAQSAMAAIAQGPSIMPPASGEPVVNRISARAMPEPAPESAAAPTAEPVIAPPSVAEPSVAEPATPAPATQPETPEAAPHA
jgi:sec-independent protein translocase protein TatB